MLKILRPFFGSHTFHHPKVKLGRPSSLSVTRIFFSCILCKKHLYVTKSRRGSGEKSAGVDLSHLKSDILAKLRDI